MKDIRELKLGDRLIDYKTRYEIELTFRYDDGKILISIFKFLKTGGYFSTSTFKRNTFRSKYYETQQEALIKGMDERKTTMANLIEECSAWQCVCDQIDKVKK